MVVVWCGLVSVFGCVCLVLFSSFVWDWLVVGIWCVVVLLVLGY